MNVAALVLARKLAGKEWPRVLSAAVANVSKIVGGSSS